MEASGSAVLLRIYTDEHALHGDRSLVDDIVRRARAARLAGVTVLRAIQGFGQSAHVHQRRPFAFDDNLSVVIEFVDEETRLRTFVSQLDDLRDIGLVTLEKVDVLRYGRSSARQDTPA